MPLSPFERIRLDKAAVDEGFGIRRADDGDWLAYESLGAPAAIRLAAVPEGYVAAIDHDGVAADLATRWPLWNGTSPAGFTAFAVPDTAPLQRAGAGDVAIRARAAARAIARVREEEPRPAADDRDRAPGRPAGGPGRLPRCADGLLGGPLRGHRLAPSRYSCARATSSRGPSARPTQSVWMSTTACCSPPISMPRSTPA